MRAALGTRWDQHQFDSRLFPSVSCSRLCHVTAARRVSVTFRLFGIQILILQVRARRFVLDLTLRATQQREQSYEFSVELQLKAQSFCRAVTTMPTT